MLRREFLRGVAAIAELGTQAFGPGLRGGFGSLGIGGRIAVNPTYFVNASTGSDSNDGRTPATAWRTLAKVSGSTFVAGDSIAFTGTFSGTLTIPSGGSATGSIKYIGYSTGATINAAVNTNGIAATDLSYITICNLTVVGAGGTSGIGISITYNAVDGVNPIIQNCNVSGFAGDGIKVIANELRTLINPLISGCVVDACTIGQQASTAGINLRGTSGAQLRGQYNVINGLIVGCVATNNTGVGGFTNWCGSGIFMANASNSVITNCTADSNGANSTNDAGPGGIWLFDCVGCTIQYCEARNTKTAGGDGGGFDLDGACVNCTMQYNYSHDNVGYGFMSFTFDSAVVLNNTNNTIRFNVSARDGRGGIRICNSSTVPTTGQVYGNVCYVSSTTGVGLKLEYNGPTFSYKIANNIFIRENAATGDLMRTSGAPTAETTLVGNDYYTPNAFRITWGACNMPASLLGKPRPGRKRLLGPMLASTSIHNSSEINRPPIRL